MGSEEGSSSTGGAVDESSSTGEAFDECQGVSDLAPEELLGGIDHIVVVMMENRSFDHYFGSAMFLENLQVDGLTGKETNLNLAGEPIGVFSLDDFTPPDPPHSWDESHLQWNLGENDGFVIRHELAHAGSAHEAMGYHTRAHLPLLYALADNYVLCDQWFSSAMGPTWPNRFYLHSGSANGQQGNSFVSGLGRIWEVLSDAGIPGRNYYSDVAWVWGGYANPNPSYTTGIGDFFAAAADGTLPAFSVIDPDFGLLGGGGNDDHPPHSPELGQIFIASIYEALAQSPAWNRCLLVIIYDEHGGFYDHVNPPTTFDNDPDFRQLGFRVPALVIGPHVRRGCVHSNRFDHTSVLSTVTRRFQLPPLNVRVNETTDLSSCIHPDYLSNPQPPARLPQMVASLEHLLKPREGTGQAELKELLDRGDIPMPRQHRRVDPGRALKLQLIEQAQRLGVVKLMP
jgi:phospholipase C